MFVLTYLPTYLFTKSLEILSRETRDVVPSKTNMSTYIWYENKEKEEEDKCLERKQP